MIVEAGVQTLGVVPSIVEATGRTSQYNDHVILYNMNGFWDATIHMLDDLQQRGMVRGQWRNYICVANSLQEIDSLLLMN